VAHRPQRLRPRLRLADFFALLGAAGFAALLVDRLVSGQPADGNLTYASVGLMLGAPVQRFAEGIFGKRNGGA
jgi:hypothetical protein